MCEFKARCGFAGHDAGHTGGGVSFTHVVGVGVGVWGWSEGSRPEARRHVLVCVFAHARNRMGVPSPMRHPSEKVPLTFLIPTVVLGPPRQSCQNLTLTQSQFSGLMVFYGRLGLEEFSGE